MAYPSVLSTYTDPSPNDRLSTTPHSSIETAQNTGLREIQAFIGTLSSTAGTLIYDIRAAASNGGGHVQTANKGGTGQTSYTKGDTLVASSSSVLSKLAVGNDGDIFTADSSVAAGVKWAPGVNSQAIQNFQFSNAFDGGNGSVYSISPVPCVLSYTHGQLFTFRAATTSSVVSATLRVSSLAAKLIKNPDGTSLQIGQIKASAMTMVQYDGHSSVFQLLSQKGGAVSLFANGVTTYQGDTASGSQTIAHGLVTTPKKIRISCRKAIGANSSPSASDGVYNGTTTSCVFWNSITGQTSGNSSTNIAYIEDSSGNSQAATVTFDVNSIILSWTKTGSPSANSINIMWEAEA